MLMNIVTVAFFVILLSVAYVIGRYLDKKERKWDGKF